ncbi:hypothetical protein [Kineococcus auxinigenes]|uniref:hypothetical protein n=1 Tax=unclassified Kineococcus TaxID=2621656 RepID=UPI003D7CCDA0
MTTTTARTAAPAAPTRRGTRWADLAVAGACLVHLWLCWRLRGFVTDDSWISVRYAENLAAGHGFVWNPGGPAVEGASNPLLVGLEALAALAGLPALRTARVLGVVAGVTCVLLVGLRGRVLAGAPAAAVGALLVGCSAPFAAWAVGGLETLLVAAVLTTAVLELARPRGGSAALAGGALALLPWLRPEGLVVAAAVVACSEGPGLLRSATRRAALRRCAWVVAVPVASQAVLEAGRLLVHGHLLPNSVLYKSGTGEGATVLVKFLEQGALVVVLAAAGTALATGRARLLAVAPLVHAVGSLGTLDSANGYSRFFMPVWPQLALLAGVAVAALLALRGRWGRPAAAATSAATAAVSAALLLAGPGAERAVRSSAQEYTACKVAAREGVAAWLRTTPPGTVFAVSDAGLVPARAGGRTAVDSFLLNDPLIQETGPLPSAQRARIVLERGPDVLVLVSREAGRFVAGYPTDARLHELGTASGYRLQHVSSGRGAGCRYHLTALAR